MRYQTSVRGYQFLMHMTYGEEPTEEKRLASESSAIGDYDNALDKPGSSFLWIGDRHHLNREEVAQFRDALSHWLAVGRLPENETTGGESSNG